MTSLWIYDEPLDLSLPACNCTFVDDLMAQVW